MMINSLIIIKIIIVNKRRNCSPIIIQREFYFVWYNEKVAQTRKVDRINSVTNTVDRRKKESEILYLGYKINSLYEEKIKNE